MTGQPVDTPEAPDTPRMPATPGTPDTQISSIDPTCLAMLAIHNTQRFVGPSCRLSRRELGAGSWQLDAGATRDGCRAGKARSERVVAHIQRRCV